MKFIYLVLLCLIVSLTGYGQTKKQAGKPATKAAAVPAKPKIDTPVNNYSIPSRTYVKVDSTYLKWTKLDTGSIEYPWHVGIDVQGRIIALLKDAAREKKVMVLENGKWKAFQEGIPDTPSRVIVDGVGGLYVLSRSNLYKSTPQGWQKVVCTSVETTGLPVGGRDGNLYKLKKRTSDFVKGTELVVWKDGCWAAAGKDGKAIMLPDGYGHFAVDGAGNVYCWENIPYGTTDYVQTVQLWNGEKWKQIGQPDMKIYDDGIDGKGRFFVYGFRDDYKKKGRFFSYWDGNAWGDAPYPQETAKDHGVNILTNNAGTLFVEAYPSASGEHDHRLFALEGDLYVRKAEEGKDFDADFNMIPLGNAVYAIDNKSRCLYKYSSGWDVKRTTYTTVAVAQGVEATSAVNSTLSSVFLFEENGKKGLKNESGAVIIRPEFDEIVICPAPTTAPVIEGVTAVPVYSSDNAVICLRSGSDKTFINLRVSPYSLRGYWETPKITCSKCNGAGREKDQTRRVEVPGEWVEGKTYTTTKSNYEKVWNSRTNTYDGVQTKSTESHKDPGYRKPSTYRTETIPGGTCTVCKGKGGSSKAEYYRYNESTRRYEAMWE